MQGLLLVYLVVLVGHSDEFIVILECAVIEEAIMLLRPLAVADRGVAADLVAGAAWGTGAPRSLIALPFGSTMGSRMLSLLAGADNGVVADHAVVLLLGGLHVLHCVREGVLRLRRVVAAVDLGGLRVLYRVSFSAR